MNEQVTGPARPTATPTNAASHRAVTDATPIPLALLMNARSGHLEAGERIDSVRRMLEEAARPHELIVLREPGALDEGIGRAIAWAQAHQGAVVVAGGDGTLNAVAQAALPARLPVGLLPQGTFNYFARVHGIASETEHAVRQLLLARPTPVQVGLLNGRVFLVNASLGLYPQMLADRESFKQQFGRYRLNAVFAALVTILREHRQWTLELDLGDELVTVRTVTLFVGNNRLQLEQAGVPAARALSRGRLAAVVVKPAGRLGMLMLALRGALGTLGEAPNATDFAFRRMVVRPRSKSRHREITVGIDGEVLRITTPLEFSVSPTPLQLLLAPHDEAPPQGTGEQPASPPP